MGCAHFNPRMDIVFSCTLCVKPRCSKRFDKPTDVVVRWLKLESGDESRIGGMSRFGMVNIALNERCIV